MGENGHSSRYAELQSIARSPLVPTAASLTPNGTVNGLQNGNDEEDEGIIRCICEFDTDDGSTVLCEQCNTWQHISCYYHPNLKIPEVHTCLSCSPRYIDAKGAAERQRRLREAIPSVDDRKIRKQAPKTHKKSKTKDSNHTPTLTNGWSPSETLHFDRKSASPRDHQPPPSKKPKISHKDVGQVNGNSTGASRPQHHRNRSSSNVLGTTSVRKKIRERPPDYYSSEFIRTHHSNTDFTPAQTNLLVDIAFTNLLSTWLDDTEAFRAATNGLTHADVFQQAPAIEELEAPVQKQILSDTSVTLHGYHPVWPYITVEKDLFQGQLVGEIRGVIGHRDDYKKSPSNRWHSLKHPDHFVFFHPTLPIYIDCRHEGTLLRYVRRSCKPNLEMKTFITDERDMRFCFTATKDIPSGEELTIAWDTMHDERLQECLSRTEGQDEKEYLHDWMETKLSHFGGCACGFPSPTCIIEYWDRRVSAVSTAAEVNGRPKTNKRRQAAKKSPSSTGPTTNSRASSEALGIAEREDDLDDNRSTSQSSRSKPSRDGTPANHRSQSGLELSARDKKKLIQQERLFERLEHDTQQGPRKKKRVSGANAPNSTPTNKLNPSHGLAHLSTHNIKHRTSDSRGGISPMRTKMSSNSPKLQSDSPGHEFHAIRPSYADSATQTESEPESQRTDIVPVHRRKPYISLSKRLLQRALRLAVRDNLEQGQIEPQSTTNESEGVNHSTHVVSSSVTHIKSGAREQFENTSFPVENDVQKEEDKDVRMKDVDVHFASNVEHPKPPSPLSKSDADTQTGSGAGMQTLSRTTPHSPPPSSSLTSGQPVGAADAAKQSVEHTAHKHNSRAPDLHVELPPPPLFSSTSSGDQTVSASPGAVSAPVLQSPLYSLSAGRFPPGPLSTSVLPPSATGGNMVTPSPVKKKISLTDYMKKNRKADTPAAEKSQSQSLQDPGTPVGALDSPALSESAKSSSPLLDRAGMKQEEEGVLATDVVKSDLRSMGDAGVLPA